MVKVVSQKIFKSGTMCQKSGTRDNFCKNVGLLKRPYFSFCAKKVAQCAKKKIKVAHKKPSIYAGLRPLCATLPLFLLKTFIKKYYNKKVFWPFFAKVAQRPF